MVDGSLERKRKEARAYGNYMDRHKTSALSDTQLSEGSSGSDDRYGIDTTTSRGDCHRLYHRSTGIAHTEWGVSIVANSQSHVKVWLNGEHETLRRLIVT